MEEILPYMNIYQDEELTGRNEDLGIIGNDTFYNGNLGQDEDTPSDVIVPEEDMEDIPESLPNQEPEEDAPEGDNSDEDNPDEDNLDE
jgi:stage V sporulation protein D (sporulation-specific penicillin-binding protein)